MDMIRNKAKSFLQIQDGNPRAIIIRQADDLGTYFTKNRIWYRGESNELEELYKQLDGKRTTFWASVPTTGMEIKKSHSGLPKLIINTLTDIIIDNFNGVDSEDTVALDEWEKIEKDNQFYKKLKKIISETMAIGDGAVKFAFDKTISELPIIEWVTGDKIEIIYKRGRLFEIVFKTYYEKGTKTYLLKEHYGWGYVSYELLDDDKIVPLNTIDDLKELKNLTFDKSVMWAVPFIIDENAKFEGRGSSKFDGKYDIFDSFDEIISQWIEAIRLGKAIRYIPEKLCPKDPYTGETLPANAFDNQYIQTESDMSENAKNQIQVEQADIPSDKYLQSYITYLGMAIQGIISSSTLGIDVKKIQDANASYERQMEKTTLYTRQGIIDALNEFIPKVINIALSMPKQLKKQYDGKVVEFDVLFGEYDSPSFDSQIDTISKAKNNGIMSIETSVKELYGDSKEEKWLEEEIARIKEEQGITSMDEPSINDDVDFNDIDTEESPVKNGQNAEKTQKSPDKSGKEEKK